MDVVYSESECLASCGEADDYSSDPFDRLYPSLAAAETQRPTIGLASTVSFVSKSNHDMPPGNIPENTHWVDMTRRDSIVVISQPPGQKNAVLGGIMALRMRVLGARAVIVAGRIRDSSELKSSGLPVSVSSLRNHLRELQLTYMDRYGQRAPPRSEQERRQRSTQ